MNFNNFYDESDLEMFPPKPIVEEQPKKMISISLNFFFYILIYLIIFNGNIKLLAAVILVLFIHESGHLFMMRRYGYADKKLYFLPFMGFFVRNDANQINLSQKLFMILMGPLPGIIIGFFLMYFGDKNKNAELVSLAWIFLVWNLVNLIPLDALDGAHASSILFSKYNYQIQLVFTVLISIICVFFIVLFKNYFVLIIPIMLFFRIKSINSMNTIRMELESRGIDCRLGFYELNNKQYWILRKELIDLNKIPMDESMINEFTQSIYEKMIGQNMKAVLLDLPYDDLEKKGKYLATFIWFLLFILPVSILILLMYFYK